MSDIQPIDLRRRFAAVHIGHDGDQFVIGRPDLGVYVAVPEAGAVFVRAVKERGSLAEGTAAASAAAGEPVDGSDFLDALAAAGLLEVPSPAVSGGRGARPIRWIAGVPPRVARRLFGRAAWACYALAAAVAVGLMATRPDLRPSWEHAWFLPDPMLALLAYLPIATVLGALHEAWHWLAGRARGVPGTFRISHRALFVVFETDLSQLVALPRRQRYGPLLAGMAVDTVLLTVALGLRLLHRDEILSLPAGLDRLLGAVALHLCFAIVWQWAAVGLRSDGYAVLANALRCHDLYRTTWLVAKDRIVRLGPAERAELASAGDRDRAVARWFVLVYLGGVLAMGWLTLYVTVPLLIGLGTWIVGGVGAFGVQTAVFWESLAVLAMMLLYYGAPGVLAVRERQRRKAGVLR